MNNVLTEQDKEAVAKAHERLLLEVYDIFTCFRRDDHSFKDALKQTLAYRTHYKLDYLKDVFMDSLNFAMAKSQRNQRLRSFFMDLLINPQVRVNTSISNQSFP